MQKIKNILLTLISLSLLPSCDEVLIDPKDVNLTLRETLDIVIEGFITTEMTRYEVKLTKPFVAQQDTSFVIPINNATVRLTEGDNTYLYELTDKPGVYQTIDSLSGKAGKTYTLVVEYENQTYTATDSLIQCDSVMDYPISEVCLINGRYEISTPRHNFGYQTPSFWENYDNDGDEEFAQIDLNDLHHDYSFNHQGSQPQGLFPSRTQFGGVEGFAGDSLELIRQAPSPAYYAYLVSLFNVTDWSTGNFSVAPGNTLSNVSAGGIGFFYATGVVRFRMTYKDLAGLSDAKCVSYVPCDPKKEPCDDDG